MRLVTVKQAYGFVIGGFRQAYNALLGKIPNRMNVYIRNQMFFSLYANYFLRVLQVADGLKSRYILAQFQELQNAHHFSSVTRKKNDLGEEQDGCNACVKCIVRGSISYSILCSSIMCRYANQRILGACMHKNTSAHIFTGYVRVCVRFFSVCVCVFFCVCVRVLECS